MPGASRLQATAALLRRSARASKVRGFAGLKRSASAEQGRGTQSALGSIPGSLTRFAPSPNTPGVRGEAPAQPAQHEAAHFKYHSVRVGVPLAVELELCVAECLRKCNGLLACPSLAGYRSLVYSSLTPTGAVPS
jgi:hypothetical protein